MKRNKNNKNTVKNYSESILTILKEDRNKSYNHKQIASKLGVNDASTFDSPKYKPFKEI